MLRIVAFVSVLVISSIALANISNSKHFNDNNTAMRMVYANVWRKTIMSMFSDAGPTNVYLHQQTLIIENANCNDPEVKSILRDTFSPHLIRKKMRELHMNVRCNTITILANR